MKILEIIKVTPDEELMQRLKGLQQQQEKIKECVAVLHKELGIIEEEEPRKIEDFPDWEHDIGSHIHK